MIQQTKHCKKNLDNIKNKYKAIKIIQLTFAIIALSLAYFAMPAAAETNLIANWAFNEDAGTVAADTSGNGNNVLLNGPTWTTGVNGNALQFDGTNDYAVNTSVNGISGTSPFSVVAWVNGKSFSNPKWSDIVRKEGSWAVQIGPNSNLNLEITGKHDTVSDIVVPTNVWTHIAVTFEGTTVKFYKNGVLGDTKIQTNIPNAGLNTIDIGGYTPWGTYLNGALDDVKVYNRALSAADINAAYLNSGTPAPTPTPAPTSETLSQATHEPTPAPTSETLSQAIHEPTPAPSTSGKTYYVAKDGTGDFKTIQEAANVAIAGDTVYVKAGTYNEYVIIKNSGSDGNYITFAAYPGHTVTLDGKGLPKGGSEIYTGLFEIIGKKYITIDGFRLINGWTGVHIDKSSSNIVIKNNYVENMYTCGILVGYFPNSDIIIENNEITRNSLTFWDGRSMMWNEMISIVDASNVEVRYNHIMQNVIGEGIDMKDGTKDGKVHHNTVENTKSVGIYVDAYSSGVSNIEIYNNIARYSQDTGFGLGSETGGLAQNINFHNNEAYNNVAGFAISRPPQQNFKDVYFTNNNAYDNNWVNYFFPSPATGVVPQSNTELP